MVIPSCGGDRGEMQRHLAVQDIAVFVISFFLLGFLFLVLYYRRYVSVRDLLPP